MVIWFHITLVAISATFLAIILLIILKRCLRKNRKNIDSSDVERVQSLQNGIARLHQVSPHHDYNKKSNNNDYYLFRRGVSTKNQSFSWADHPSLVTDAVENGWSRFSFATFVSSSSPSSVKSGKGLFGAARANEKPEVEIGWEVCEGSADFMQKIRLKNFSVIRTGLPLPGPNLGNSSFPQEAYFEITIFSFSGSQLGNKERKGKADGDKIKLIGEDFNAKNSPGSGRVIDEVKIGKNDGKNEGACLCVGLTLGGPLQLRTPGSYEGSVGFNSTGSVFLDGTKLVFESENDAWGISDKVIGCGYNPSQKKVFFTLDAQLVHEIQCKTEDFGSPLYPTIAANLTEITILVNLGQSPFKFMPPNMQRTPNPCFIGPLGTSPALGYEDSKELFSMGRIDSQWLQKSGNIRSNNTTVNSLKALEFDQESDGDLFEIVLDSTGRSPFATIHQ